MSRMWYLELSVSALCLQILDSQFLRGQGTLMPSMNVFLEVPQGLVFLMFLCLFCKGLSSAPVWSRITSHVVGRATGSSLSILQTLGLLDAWATSCSHGDSRGTHKVICI